MSSTLEIGANLLTAVSILLAGRNSVHTWWTGIIGCLLFGAVYARSQLYADATLQLFFIVTSVIGWRRWRSGGEALSAARPVRQTQGGVLGLAIAGGMVGSAAYAWMLHRFTDAYAPVADSVVLFFSMIAQFLLMDRRVESWWGWLFVNTISVPLFYSRGLYLTSALYVAFWVNAVFSLGYWRRLAREAA
jgi:nicotinamide mononucleotide transporter